MTAEVGHTEVYVRKGWVVMVGIRMTSWPTRPGYFGIQWDSSLPNAKLRLAEPDEKLGAAVRSMLLASPLGPQRLWHTVIEKAPGFRWEGMTHLEPGADDRIAELFGLSSRRGLFAGTRFMPVSLRDGEVTFEPTWRKGVEFEGFNPDYAPKHPVRVPFSEDDAALGAGLREAHARSSG